jgi:hypothetical protein
MSTPELANYRIKATSINCTLKLHIGDIDCLVAVQLRVLAGEHLISYRFEITMKCSST